jgi:glycolate oxidase
VEKMRELGLSFSLDDLALMQRVRDVFDPAGRANPGKIFPTPGVCVEQRAPRRLAAL